MSAVFVPISMSVMRPASDLSEPDFHRSTNDNLGNQASTGMVPEAFDGFGLAEDPRISRFWEIYMPCRLSVVLIPAVAYLPLKVRVLATNIYLRYPILISGRIDLSACPQDNDKSIC